MRDFDLNLLRVFDALVELRSVTEAANRLGVTQSAVSHSLGRLRKLLDDPLFLRGPNGLQPSARAEQIAPGIRAGIQQVREALTPPQFTPFRATRNFTIAAGAYFCTLIIPALVARLRDEAPGVELHVLPLVEDGTAMLDQGAIDLALGSQRELPARFHVEPLFAEEMVWIAARSNALIAGSPDLETIMRFPRVRVTSRGQTEIDPLPLANLPVDGDQTSGSHTAATVFDSQTALRIVACTDTIACIPRQIAEFYSEAYAIAILMEATDTKVVPLAMTSHSRHRSDPGLAWFRQLMLQLSKPT